jgi:hypothetical protein
VLIIDTTLPRVGCVELIRKVLPVVPETRILTVLTTREMGDRRTGVRMTQGV